jgi:hypothetical protein
MALTKVTTSMIDGLPINAKDFGVSPSSTASQNSVALQAALDSLTNGGVLYISDDIDIDDEIEIQYSDVAIVGLNAPLITQKTAGKRVFFGFDINNILIQNVRLDGEDSSNLFTTSGALAAIDIQKTATTPKNIRIEDCEVFNFYSCISCFICDNVWIQRNDVHNFYKNGVITSRCKNWSVDNNIISDCDFVGADNAYGVICVGGSDVGIIQERCSISFNVIKNIVSWDAIMTHDSDTLRIIGNHIENVRTGVDISLTAAISPTRLQDFIILNNYIQLTNTDSWSGSPASHAGITVVGEVTATPFVYAKRIIISNNIVDNWNQATGIDNSGNNPGAFKIDTVKNCMITNNLFTNMGVADPATQTAIGVNNTGDNLQINGNMVQGQVKYAVTCNLGSGITANLVSIQNNMLDTTASDGRSVRLSGSGTYSNIAVSGNLVNQANKSVEVDGPVIIDYEISDYGQGPSEVTISSGAITVYRMFHIVDTEGGAATDDLDTINGTVSGNILVLRSSTGTRTVVVKDGTGNLKLNGDFSMDKSSDTIALIFDGNSWLELSRSNND